jgi:hypothetical protein
LSKLIQDLERSREAARIWFDAICGGDRLVLDLQQSDLDSIRGVKLLGGLSDGRHDIKQRSGSGVVEVTAVNERYSPFGPASPSGLIYGNRALSSIAVLSRRGSDCATASIFAFRPGTPAIEMLVKTTRSAEAASVELKNRMGGARPGSVFQS